MFNLPAATKLDEWFAFGQLAAAVWSVRAARVGSGQSHRSHSDAETHPEGSLRDGSRQAVQIDLQRVSARQRTN